MNSKGAGYRSAGGGFRARDELRTRVVESFANGNGKTQGEIAADEKVSQATVSRILKAAGVEVRRRGWFARGETAATFRRRGWR